MPQKAARTKRPVEVHLPSVVKRFVPEKERKKVLRAAEALGTLSDLLKSVLTEKE